MAVGIYFSVWGDDVINRDLLRFSHRAGNAQPAFRSIQSDMIASIAKNFATEGASSSGGWAPLKESTILEKQRLGFPLDILHRTLALKTELTSPDGSWRVTDDSLTFVPSDEIFYGEFHMRGTVNMPARRPIDFTTMERRGYVKKLQRFVVTGVVG